MMRVALVGLGSVGRGVAGIIAQDAVLQNAGGAVQNLDMASDHLGVLQPQARVHADRDDPAPHRCSIRGQEADWFAGRPLHRD